MILRIFIFVTALIMAYPAFAETGVRVVVPCHDIARGQIMTESDLVFGTIPASTVFTGYITAMDELVGHEARRVLRAGETVRTVDVRNPIIITKGAVVTMTFDAPGVTVTAIGRALSEGGIGDTVTIQNPASYRQISATVIGPGTVRADSLSPVAIPAHLASR